MSKITTQDLINIVGSLGFPIAACCALFWYITKVLGDFLNEMKKSISELSTSVDKTTDATIKLVTTVELLHRIEVEKEEGE